MNRKKKRHIAAILCIVLLFVTFASLFYIAKEENHQCTGDDCPVCACVHQAEQNLKNLGTGFIAEFCAIFVVLSGSTTVCAYAEELFFTSLVSQKVRLNN